jgi:hypothetical protein
LGKVVSAVYPEIGIALRGAAAMSVSAHVEYLESLGELQVRRNVFGARLSAT